MPCLIALVVFSILGIFSASHRKLAKEAFDCVFQRLTLRPCDTGFDVKVKAKVLGPILPRYPRAAAFINRFFEPLAWVFMLAIMISSALTLRGIYYFWAWGDCNGQYSSGGFCAFDPTGENVKTTGTEGAACKDVAIASRNLSLEGFDENLFPSRTNLGVNEDSASEVVFMGCYSCQYTRKVYPMLKRLFSTHQPKVTFVHFPVEQETTYLLPYDVCIYNQSQELYWRYIDLMFSSPLPNLANEGWVREQVAQLGINLEKMDACLNLDSTKAVVQTMMSESLSTGIYGTPTIFINGTPVVGPKPERVYKRLLQESWF